MTVFYRKYRPQRLSDLVGQDHIKENLLAQLESGEISHGYLFFGQKGTGKTSCARIFAKAVNCEVYSKQETRNRKQETGKFGEPCNKCVSCLSIADGSCLDLIEIDAASNRGIDEIRDLREKIKLSPVLGRFKVYIIDEAHMLTTEAFNALLKTLEEPPSHAIFILCTTEAGKLPATILSRLQRFGFLRATNDDLARVIKKIAKAEGIKVEDSAVFAIVEAADGSYRDATSLLDQLSSNKRIIGDTDVSGLVKAGGWNQIFNFAEYLALSKLREAVLSIEDIAESGADVSFFAKQIMLFLEKLLFLKIGITEEIFDSFDMEQVKKMTALAGRFTYFQLQNLMKLFLIAESEIKIYPLPQIPLVLATCKYINLEEQNDGVSDGNRVDVGAARKEEKVSQGLPAKNAKESRTVYKNRDEKRKAKTTNSKEGSLKSIKEVEERWGEFLNKVKPVNAHVVALLRSTRPVDFDGSCLTMEVFYRFHKEKLEEPKILRMLSDIWEQVMASPVKFKFVLAQKGSKPPSTVVKSDVVEVNRDEFEIIAQEIFSK